MPHVTIEQFEQLIRRDPARRGLIAHEATYGRLCAGHLAEAAVHLADHAVHVGLITGFYIPHAQPPAAETDGPLGSLMLAHALHSIGVDVTILTDDCCVGAVRATASATGFDTDSLLIYPHNSPEWVQAFFTTGRGRNITHLIALERVGPSHTLESLSRQQRDTPPPLELFTTLVPAAARDRCHNMRGQVIDEHTADMHRLFDELHRYRPEARTIGIGDGANEIGMGVIPWEELHRRLDEEHAARIPCRVPTTWNIVAGTSNWGGYALAAAVLLLRSAVDNLRDWNSAQQFAVLRHIVEHGPAVDGATARHEPTVDGLPFRTYIQPWEGIRRLLGFTD